MITYIAFTGSPDKVREKYYTAKKAIAISSTFTIAHKREFISQNGCWGFVAAATSEAELNSRVFTSQRGAFLINGPFIHADENFSISNCLDMLINSSPETLFNYFSGAFNCTSISLKHGLLGFSDFSGVYPVYKASSDGVAFISNSPQLLKNVNNFDYDLFSLGWLIGHANIFGENMPYAGVKLITPGTYSKSKISSNGYFIDSVMENNIWPMLQNGEEINPDSIQWGDLTDQLASSLLEMSRTYGELKLSLTGGKDSRLVLALALHAGLKEKISTFTKGPEGSPEIECAKNVANCVGVRHESLVSKCQKQNLEFDYASTWRKLRQSNFRYFGSICLWDGLSGNIFGTDYDVTGFGGELYRGPGGHAKQFKRLDFIKDDDLLKYWINYHQKMDPLGLLTDEMKKHQLDHMKSWICKNRMYRKDTLPEKFFVENRLSNWNGPLAQQVSGKVKIMPLLNSQLARTVFKLSPSDRNSELVHFNLMRCACPSLAKLPFLKDAWSDTLKKKYNGFDFCHEAFAKEASHRKIQAWQWDFVESQKNEIVDLIDRCAAESNVMSIMDVNKLTAFVRCGNYTETIQVKNILAAVGICLTLTGGDESVFDKA